VAQTGPVQPDDLAVTLAVRKDLGPQHDDAVLAEFLDRVGDAIDKRVDERLAQRRREPGLPADPHGDANNTLALASLVLGIPITAIVLGSTDGAASIGGLLIAWTGIGVVNVAHALHALRR
jgi:hypothetical protein